jgi:FSR family fosmidomycin resistance protein-like MFS transporter
LTRLADEPIAVEPETAVGRIAPAAIAPAISPNALAARRYWFLGSTHLWIDVFPILFSALLWPLQERLSLTSLQVTAIIMATPIFSGGLQPVFAWLTDKHDTRLCGPLGLAIGGVCCASIGLAQNFWQLLALQIVGVIATGMYHPIATAVAGQSGGRLFRNGRAQAIGIFIAFGMIGHALGAELGPLINSLDGGRGMPYLAWLIPPTLLLAIVMHLLLRRAPHRHDNHREIHESFSDAERRRRWRVIGLLAAQNALRFTVNVGLLVVMINVWAKSKMLQSMQGAGDLELSAASASLVGHLSVALTIGMCVGVLTTGRLVRQGREKGPLIWLSVLGALAIFAVGPLGDLMWSVGRGAWWSLIPTYLCLAATAVGFFATFPIATSLAQRLMPGHTGLVTSLMMGAGWAFSASSALLAPVFFGLVSVDEAPRLDPWRINLGFAGFGLLLLVAGLLAVLIPRDLVAEAAEHH